MGKPRTYTDQELKDAVETSRSVAEVLKKLNLKPAGGNYVSIKMTCSRLTISLAHFVGQGWNKGGKTWKPKIPLEDIFSNKVPYTNTDKLRKRLINEGIFEKVCYSCGIEIWLGKPISLELEHIDGDRMNNSRDNLTLLCPNCHAQTDTYRGRNINAGVAQLAMTQQT